MNKLSGYFPSAGPNWTSVSVLPGGEGIDSAASFAAKLANQYPWLTSGQVKRFSTSYGVLSNLFLQGTKSVNDLGEHFGAGLTAAEVNYLMQYEWAFTADDVVWRRSKLGLRLNPHELSRLTSYIDNRRNMSSRSDRGMTLNDTI